MLPIKVGPSQAEIEEQARLAEEERKRLEAEETERLRQEEAERKRLEADLDDIAT